MLDIWLGYLKVAELVEQWVCFQLSKGKSLNLCIENLFILVVELLFVFRNHWKKTR